MDEEKFVHYTIGIPALDDHHWKIFEQINFIKHLLRDKNVHTARIVLASLYELVYEHLKDEEKMMQECGFPYEEFHTKYHPRILESLKEIIGQSDRMLVSGFTIDKFKNIFSEHIEQQDSQFTEYYEKCKK